MIAKVYSAIPQGYDGQLVEVEGDASRSLPSFNIVGMANKTISEARERVRSAIVNSNFRFPDKRVTVNLAPAELAKDGTHLDLPIALAVLALSQQLLPGDLHGRLFAGELSLNGQTKPIRGIINIVEAAVSAGFSEVYVPIENLPQATLVPHATIIGVDNLKSLVLHLNGSKPLPSYQTDSTPINVFSTTFTEHKNNPLNTNFSTQSASTSVNPHVVKNNCSGVAAKISHKTQPEVSHVVEKTQTDGSQKPSTIVVKNNQTGIGSPSYLLDDIRGQTLAKRALIIAIAGNHNLLLSGPPGSGKTMLARVAHSLLPPPTPIEQVEIAKLYSLISTSVIPSNRPFRNPHHTASATAIIGGGPNATPGEISLAHRGVLFLDEMPEYARPVLEALRQPLEDRKITITRTHGRATYPANFMLIGTMNPCPCGYLDDPDHPCTCLPTQILNYQKRLSGPILDRIDLTVHVKRLPSQDLLPSAVKTVVKPQVSERRKSKTFSSEDAQRFLGAAEKNTKTDKKSALNPPNPSSSEHSRAKSQILAARACQATRYGDPSKHNGSLSSAEITQFLALSPAAEKLLQTAADQLNLSARGYFKVIKVAQTIADLEDSAAITPEHIAEALTFRHQPSPRP